MSDEYTIPLESKDDGMMVVKTPIQLLQDQVAELEAKIEGLERRIAELEGGGDVVVTGSPFLTVEQIRQMVETYLRGKGE